MARLRKFSYSDHWYIVWTEGRRSHRCSTGATDRLVAERVLARFEAERTKPPESFVIEEVLDAYLQAKQGASRWSKNREYELRPLRPHFGNLPPSLVNSALVRGYVAKRRTAGKSDGTIDKELRMLRAALHWAVKEQWMPAAPYVETPGGTPPRDRWLTRAEAAKLIAAAQAPHARLFIVLALNAGARTRAILDLTWDRVDLDRGVILFPPSLPNSRKRTAVVPINRALRLELEAAQAAARTDWVIEHLDRPVGSIKTGFRAAVRRAGLAHCTPHDLRRTAATWMVMDGIPLDKVARFLGDTREMIEKVYGHHSPDYLRDAASSLENGL